MRRLFLVNDKAEPVAVNVDTDGTGEYQDEVLEQAVRRLNAGRFHSS